MKIKCLAVLATCLLAACHPHEPAAAGGTEPASVVMKDPVDAVEEQIRRALDPVMAIDNHSHLQFEGPGFHPEMDPVLPPTLRSTNPDFRQAVIARFKLPEAADLMQLHTQAMAIRDAEMKSAPVAYWNKNLDAAGVAIVLVNQRDPFPPEFDRLRWVAEGSALLFPKYTDKIPARSPLAVEYAAEYVSYLDVALRDGGLTKVPDSLGEYIGFAKATLQRWRKKGAMAIKISNAYVRSLEFVEPGATRAEAEQLYKNPNPSAQDFLRLQNHLAREVFLAAGEVGLPVHFHTGIGRPPFIRLSDAAVRTLESTLTDPTLFGTQFVLLHAGNPDYADAGYMASKPHVWVDISSVPALLPDRELRQALRALIVFAPSKVLFGTDAIPFPTIPVGTEVHHIALAKKVRRALYRVLAELVVEKAIDIPAAIQIGKGVLHDNAQKLYNLPQ